MGNFNEINQQSVHIENGRVIPKGGVFSDMELKKALEIGHIVCDPYPTHINGSSIDVRLGHYFYHTKTTENGKKELLNPFDKDDIDDYFGEYYEAKPWSRVVRKLGETAFSNLDHVNGIPEDHPVIVLRPEERILAHTHEFIGILPPGTTQMQARSTTGRLGISACLCAGWGDPGYVNRWTMEVLNLNNRHVVLPVGYRLAQIVFSSTGPVEDEYSKSTGSYQNISGQELDAIKAAWHPSQMLPRSYNNEIIMPSEVEGLNGTLK